MLERILGPHEFLSWANYPPHVDFGDNWMDAFRSSSERLIQEVEHCRDALRNRLLGGIPWGTLLLSCLLVFVYLSVQNGAGRWSDPLVIPFTSWSYSHPLGVALGPVSHTNPEHLLDNLAGVLVFGSLAEYVFAHKRVSNTNRSRFRGSPRLRAVVLFPAGALGVGLLGSAFSWGPTIGFSNVVFAFAGFAVVRYPILTVVAVSVRDGLAVLGRAIDQPAVVATGTRATEPWFVDIAVQGHLFGLLVGILLGAVTLYSRDEDPPSACRLGAGMALFSLVQSLWVVWWPRGSSYVLGRGLGVVLVACIATLGTAGVILTVSGSKNRVSNPYVGVVILLVPLAIMAGIAIPINATTDVTAPTETETVEINGYEVTYIEEGTNQRLAPFAAVTGNRPTTGGVVVVNPERGIWTQTVDRARLAADGTASVYLGGIGWERTVFVLQRSWRMTGDEVASQVWVHPNDGLLHRVFASEPATGTAVVDGYNVSIVPDGVRFEIAVSRDNETVGTATVPHRGQTESIGNLTVSRESDTLIASVNRTSVPVAWRE
jgi:membrane associated rhomboid family serine protease